MPHAMLLASKNNVGAKCFACLWHKLPLLTRTLHHHTYMDLYYKHACTHALMHTHTHTHTNTHTHVHTILVHMWQFHLCLMYFVGSALFQRETEDFTLIFAQWFQNSLQFLEFKMWMYASVCVVYVCVLCICVVCVLCVFECVFCVFGCVSQLFGLTVNVEKSKLLYLFIY